MTKERWIEVLVVVVILGTLGFLATTVFDMNGTLNRVDTTLGNTSSRVERIAAALPGIAIRVAEEEVNQPFHVAVASTIPFERDGDWMRYVHAIDPQDRTVTTFVMNLEGADDSMPVLMLRGAAWEGESTYVTFGQMVNWSQDVRRPATIPSFIDPSYSFVLRGQGAHDTVNHLDQFLRKESEWQLPDSVTSSWHSLALELENNSTQYGSD